MTEIVQNKNGVSFDIDALVTDVNGKADKDLTNCTRPYIVETYRNGSEWYRVCSDGWCEQGGLISKSSQSSIDLLKNYPDTNYFIQCTGHDSAYNYVYISVYSKTTSGFTVSVVKGTNAATTTVCWEAKGYIS